MWAVVAGDENTFRVMYRLKQCTPVDYMWIMVYPGDWHLLLHSAKALLKRNWGAGIEHVTKELSGDDTKAADGSNYRRAHHHLTDMYKAFMTEIAEEYYCEHPWHARQAADMERRILDWIKAQAEEHQTFKLWARFLLKDYSAYLTLRTALRTGDFKLCWAVIRRIAPVFCGYGKDRYQWLVSVQLANMARLTEDDFKGLSYLLSTSLDGNVFARVGLNENQVFKTRPYKGAVMKITRAYVRKMAAMVEARELAVSAVKEKYVVTGRSRDPVAEPVLKRRKAVLAATPALRGGSAFQTIEKSTLMALG